MSAKIYIQATDAEKALLQSVMVSYHPALLEGNVKVAFTMARKFDSIEQPMHCVKFAGANAAAVMRKVPPRRRVYDPHDVEIEVDGMTWDELTEQKRIALLDHELHHVTLVVGDDNAVQTDDSGRPKVRLIPDDFILTGFYSIARRHHNYSLEYLSVMQVHRELLRVVEEGEPADDEVEAEIAAAIA